MTVTFEHHTMYIISLLSISVHYALTMPCVFSGIFYIEAVSNRQLQCQFKDEDNIVHHLALNHFQSLSTADHPFPDAFEMVQSGTIYFIAGTFAIYNMDNILVTPSNIQVSN